MGTILIGIIDGKKEEGIRKKPPCCPRGKGRRENDFIASFSLSVMCV
jgi:hypothetical protein